MTDSPALRLYAVRVDGLPPQANTLSWLIEKGMCYLSPNTKLADSRKGAQFIDRELADAFAAAVLPVMRKRHGDQVALVVEPRDSAPGPADLARSIARARHDTSIVGARLREKNFAPNQVPLIIAADLA